MVTNQRAGWRNGTTAVEMAFIMPILLLFLFAIFEFGHAMMVRAALLSTAKEAARMGSIGETTTEDVMEYISSRLGKVFAEGAATVYIKDAAVFDDPNYSPGALDASTLNDIELSEAETLQPFIVQIQVPYQSIALMPPFWASGLVIVGNSVVRHE